MTIEHIIAPGEYLALLALRLGFRDYRSIWNDPANAELKKKRTNPQSLAPGDIVRIPILEAPAFARATDQTHRITVGGGPILLRFRLDDQSHKALANRSGKLTIGGRSAKGTTVVQTFPNRTTGGEGELNLSVTGEPVDGEFAIPPLDPKDLSTGATFRFLVGQLEPVDTPRGMRARLTNLGYFAGASDADEDQLEWATEEFQCDEKIPKAQRGLNLGDRKKMLPTWNALGKRHGDMLPGEELAE